MNSRRPLFWQLYPAFMVISIGSLFVVAVHFYLTLKQSLVSFQDSTIKNQMSLVDRELSESLYQEEYKIVDKNLKELGHLFKSRMVILTPNGVVVASSEGSIENYPNMSLNQEILSAMQVGEAKSIRYSREDNIEYAFYAKALRRDGQVIGVLQISRSLKEIYASLWNVYFKILAVCFVLAIALAVISWWVARNLSRPLEKLRYQALRISRGDFTKRALINPLMSLEVDALGRAMNKMAGQLKKRLQQITDDKMQKDIILSSLSEGVLAVSNVGKIIEMNHIAHKIFDVPIEQPYEGRRVQEVIRIPEIEVFVQSALSKNVAYEESLKLLLDDKYTFLNLKSRPLVQPSGEKTGIVIVITDVTKMKKLEDLRKDFVANVSHELRTPLTSIQGYAETLLNSSEDMTPPMQKQFISTIFKHSSGLESMVNDLLELSRVENETGAEGAGLEAIEVQELFAEIKGRYLDLAKEKQVVMLFEDTEVVVQGMRGLLIQALSNLVINALYYTPPDGTVKVFLTEEGGFHIFHVKDSGVGIDKKHIPRLFERFYRVDEARNRREGGSGLGLAIVKHIALVHAGEVTVNSEVGQGSHFQFKIPVRKQFIN
tara:strand:+ start:34543 stop:36345 length:1803 start_codon:yes stop_codon:yes gene_type:complete